MTTSKKSVARLVEICYHLGIRDVVFSPGSRNAPLIIAFTQSDKFNIYNIPDERVAAFYAMGLSIKSGVPSIICCTSGTAVLNYAPAICEAYYQYVPMLVITADRPVDKIDQGIGQSMHQKNVYQNYIKGSYQLIEEAESEEDLLQNDNYVVDAIRLTSSGNLCPVHINIPLREPLYDQIEYNPKMAVSKNQQKKENFILSDQLKSIWSDSKRKLIICGQMKSSKILEEQLKGLCNTQQTVLMTETTSNVYVDGSLQCIDRVIDKLKITDVDYKPDLLIYIGGQIISKKVKKLFSEFGIKEQWFVNPEESKDTFENLTAFIRTDVDQFVSRLGEMESPNDVQFQSSWSKLNKQRKEQHDKLIPSVGFSDLAVFDYILKSIPSDSVLHSSNSTVIRYVQLFDQRPDLVYCCNRGVSGIDGSTTTAMGYAQNSERMNFLITGDMSFFYDSNAFWHRHIPNNLKIILINNEGGSIFRIIPGPDSTDALEQHFEAHHSTQAVHLAKMYDLDYFKAHNKAELEFEFPKFLSSTDGRTQLIEIVTPRLENDKVLKAYFDSFK